MLRDEIKNYTDGLGYVCPHPVEAGVLRGCDNETMFTSEYHVMLHKRKEDLPHDAEEWEIKMMKCMKEPGLMVRSPGDTWLDSPDNMLGVLCAAQVLERPLVAKLILSYGYRHLGIYNPTGESQWIWSAFLWRQPQLFAACNAAAGKLNVLTRYATVIFFLYLAIPGPATILYDVVALFVIGIAARIWVLPSAIWSALVILYAGLRNYPTDGYGDERRLAWLLVQIMKPHSILCWLASKVWYWKLHKDYPESNTYPGMRGVAYHYYAPNGVHPFSLYWVD